MISFCSYLKYLLLCSDISWDHRCVPSKCFRLVLNSVSLWKCEEIREACTKCESPETFGGQGWILLFRIIQASIDSDVEGRFSHIWKRCIYMKKQIKWRKKQVKWCHVVVCGKTLLSFLFSQFEQFIMFSLSNIFLFEKEIVTHETQRFCAYCVVLNVLHNQSKRFQFCTINWTQAPSRGEAFIVKILKGRKCELNHLRMDKSKDRVSLRQTCLKYIHCSSQKHFPSLILKASSVSFTYRKTARFWGFLSDSILPERSR